ncbi:hypothetical protein CPJCM30710_08240 [Clostridium polyendosporum]|uniref:YibE/F-like protein n=1 Tax=Clostridium polyendosporum TaxID=69208 RepID=A0A919VL23_9CLOT|nr:YibE/F family protein [Clostridium polyendosporum]GIM28158.1 hypothetical protein CPJCM30710_08240 [Clostridium polyendosporum]
MKKILLFLFIIFCTINISTLNVKADTLDNPNIISARAKVVGVKEENNSTGISENKGDIRQIITVQVTNGKYKGKVLTIENTIRSDLAYNLDIHEKDTILVLIMEDKNGNYLGVNIEDMARDTYLLYLVLIFALLMIIIGKLKGVKSLITLVITGFTIWKVFIPMIIKGYSPIGASILTCVLISITTLVITSGLNNKTLSALFGTLSGVIIAGVISLIIGKYANITGFANEDAQLLINAPIKIDLKGLLFAGIIMGSLGAVMDIGISISSAIFELKEVNKKMSKKDLITSGMNIGKDIMGTMSNTLILAYVGSSIQMILLFVAYNMSASEVINKELIASEILRALSGSIGLVCAIPITVGISSLLAERKNNITQELPDSLEVN